ncbi:beta-Ala-His dipeptidase, partial [Candidatus Bipolaricaulota bacterium]|nr:beta-Ala-His dipeptidase [Candidatus Bipolaricaulota bacterium]
VTAEGTTLGADNGIGVAIALAVATGDYEVGPLDYLFTVDEERGLNGAKNLDPGFLRGDKLINLDSEDFGAFTIGCAGGGKTEIDLPIEWVDDPDGRLVEVSVCGLAGGHSGEDIDRGRANANKLLGRMLDGVGKDLDFRLAEISGGDKHNAIPREASALLSYEGKVGELKRELEEAFAVFREEYAETEPEMELGVEKQPGVESDRVMTVEAGRTALDLLLALPHGVMAYDQRFESTVETSSNLASIRTERERIKVLVSSRSSRGSKLESLRKRIELIAGSFGAQVSQNEAYPAWQPIRDSELLTRAVEVFRDLRGRDPEVRTIHGGLETGIIGKKVEGLEMIALGPNIEFPHSPDERMEVESVRKFWDFLLELLGSLA